MAMNARGKLDRKGISLIEVIEKFGSGRMAENWFIDSWADGVPLL